MFALLHIGSGSLTDTQKKIENSGEGKKPCFIMVGAPRTGTTLLANVLGAHPRIAMFDEEFHGAVRFLIGNKIPAVKLCTPSQIQHTKKWQPYFKLVQKNGFLRKRFRHRLIRSRLSATDYNAIFDAKFLVILRDPTRSLDALMRRENMKRAQALDHLTQAYSLFKTLADQPEFNSGIISFDRYLADAEGQSRALAAWAGLDYSDDMLDGAALNTRYVHTGIVKEKASDVTADAPVADDLKDLTALYQRLLLLAF